MRGLQGSSVAVGSAVALVTGVLVVPAATSAAPVKDYSLKAGSYPFAVAVGPQGDAYSANLYGSSISRVSSSGVLSDPWGQVNSPRAVAVDDQGNVYAIAAGNVARFQPDGSAETGWAVLDPMAGATSIAIDVNRNVYTANQSQGSISKITPQGGVTQNWAALGVWPADIAVDGNGNLYTVNSSENSVSRVTPDGTVTTTWAKLAQSASPSAIAVDSANNVYTANVNNRTISRITPAGQVTRSWATLHPDSGPIDLAIDADDNVYTANNNDETVSRVTPTGVVTQSWAVLAEGSTPRGIAVAPDKLYVANAGNDTISEIPLVTPPASPSNVVVGLASATTVEIAWTPPPDTGGAALSGYVVRRYRDGGIAAEAAIPVGPNATNVSDSAVSKGSSYAYSVAAVNAAGEGTESPRSNTVLPGTSPPPGPTTGVTIDGGANYTNTKNVELTISWPGTAAFMRISNDGGFIPALTQAYDVQGTVPWTLDDSVAGQYTKIIYVRFGGSGVDPTRSYSDDIILDTVAPVITSATAVNQQSSVRAGSLASQLQGRKRLVIRTRAKDKISGLARIQVARSRGGTKRVVKPYRKLVSVPRPAGAKRVFVRVRDRADNWSTWKRVRVG